MRRLFSRPPQGGLFGFSLFAAILIASAPVDRDTHVATLISSDLYKLSGSVAVLTRGCSAISTDVRVDRRNQKLIFVSEQIEECAIESWVAPTAADVLGLGPI